MYKGLLDTACKVLDRNGLPYAAVPEVAANMRKAKAAIDKMFGLTEENLYRIEIEVSKTEEALQQEYPQTYAVIAHLLHQAQQGGMPIELATLSLLKNEVLAKGQLGKVSRLVAKQLEDNSDVLKYCEAELKLKTSAQFLPKLGDIIKSGRKLVISTNFLDFITASDNCTYTSCHAMNGSYFNGNLAYAMDNMTVISYITEPKSLLTAHEIKKLGRGWVYVNTDSCHIVQAKSYGGYFDVERELARKYMIERMASEKGIAVDKFSTQYGIILPATSLKKSAIPKDNPDGHAHYLDNYGMDVSFKGAFSYPTLSFAPAACLECGITTGYSSKGSCTAHRGKRTAPCGHCGNRDYRGNMRSIDGHLVCTRCIEANYFYCNDCGTYHPKASAVPVHNGNSVCPTCAQNYTTCECCGKGMKKGRGSEIAGVGVVCETCQKSMVKCTECGKYHLQKTGIFGKYIGRLCPECGKNAHKCVDCGDLFPADAMAGASCIKCDAAKVGAELPAEAAPKYKGLPAGWSDFVEVVG